MNSNLDFNGSKKIIFDRNYLKRKLESGLGNKKVKIISGINKVGKTFLLKEFYNELKKEKPYIHCLYIDTAQKLWNSLFWSENLVKECENLGTGPSAVFIDGIQKITDYHKAVKQLAGSETLDVFITFQGIFSLVCPDREVSGSLYEEHLLLPLSFKEIKASSAEILFPESGSQKFFDFYMNYGGLPFLSRFYGNKADSTEYLELYAKTLAFYIYGDAKKIRNPESLNLLLGILSRKTGENLSAGEISAFFSGLKETLSVQGVLDYVEFCCCRGIIQGIEVSEFSKKDGTWRILKGAKTYYFFDLGLRNYFISLEDRDYKPLLPGEEREKRLKNCVFLELIFHGWKLSEGKIKNKKNGRIDFVCTRDINSRVSVEIENPKEGNPVKNNIPEDGLEKIYVHCCASIPVKPFSIPPELDYKTVLSPFWGLGDGWKKILVTEEIETGIYRGINVVSVKDFISGSFQL